LGDRTGAVDELRYFAETSLEFVSYEISMPLDSFLLSVLACPEDKSPVHLAEITLVNEVNRKISSGALRNRAGHPIKEQIDGGLIRADGKYLYPIREEIPVMLIDEAIALA
jgi:uncharacterized protein YbaR (Trm112 family)